MRKLYIWLGRILYWVVWPGSWLYLRWSQRARILLVCGDEILVVHNWLSAGKWILPGGGVQRHEEVRLGLLRELQEETGVSLPPASIRVMSTEVYRIHGFRYLCHFLSAEVSEKPPTTRQPFEIVEIAWVKRASVNARSYGADVLRALQLLDSK